MPENKNCENFKDWKKNLFCDECGDLLYLTQLSSVEKIFDKGQIINITYNILNISNANIEDKVYIVSSLFGTKLLANRIGKGENIQSTLKYEVGDNDINNGGIKSVAFVGVGNIKQTRNNIIRLSSVSEIQIPTDTASNAQLNFPPNYNVVTVDDTTVVAYLAFSLVNTSLDGDISIGLKSVFGKVEENSIELTGSDGYKILYTPEQYPVLVNTEAFKSNEFQYLVCTYYTENPKPFGSNVAVPVNYAVGSDKYFTIEILKVINNS